jgi:NADPH:quinone reductase-like Zn-dependent oxidoreductase
VVGQQVQALGVPQVDEAAAVSDLDPVHTSGFFPPGRPAIQPLIDEIADLIRAGVLETSAGKKFGLDQIHAAVAEAESVGRTGKVLIAP